MSDFDGDLTEKQMLDRIQLLEHAIKTHRSQKADDRCIEDDDRLYEALGDGIKCDRRVGDKAAMIVNCARFIERRCESGGWPTYAQLEAERDNLAQAVRKLKRFAPGPIGKGKHHDAKVRKRTRVQQTMARNKRLEVVIRELLLVINLDCQPVDKEHLQMVKPEWFVRIRDAARTAAKAL